MFSQARSLSLPAPAEAPRVRVPPHQYARRHDGRLGSWVQKRSPSADMWRNLGHYGEGNSRIGPREGHLSG